MTDRKERRDRRDTAGRPSAPHGVADPDRPVTVTLNGEPRTLPAGSTLAAAVAAIVPGGEPTGRGVAAALNENVVPRSAWELTPLGDGDRVEVLTAVQGG